MTMGDGSEIRIPVRLDTSQIADDLGAVDREVARLQQRMTAAYNRGMQVRRGRAPRATSIEDVGANRAAWSPEVKALERQLGLRLQQLEQAARSGATRPPLTAAQESRQAAQQRLMQRERQLRAQTVDLSPQSIDRFARALMQGSGNLVAMGLARGAVGRALWGASALAQGVGGASDAGSAAGAGAAGAGVAGFLGGAVAAIGAAVGVGLATSSNQAQFQRTAALLRGSMIGGPTLGLAPGIRALGVMRAAQGFNVSMGQGATLANTLALGGVGPRDIMQSLSSTMALSRLSGVDPQTLIGLTAQMGGAGGMSGRQINQAFQDVANQGATSIDKLIDAMKALATTAATATRDVAGLAAVQAFVGRNLNAGQLLQPALSATGATAIQQMALLGLTPPQFAQAQAHPAMMLDRIAGLVRRVDRGPYGPQIAESLLQQTGLLNTANINPAQLSALIGRMATGTPQQAEQAAARIMQATQTARQDPNVWLRQIATNTQNQVSAQDRANLAIQNLATAMLNRQTGATIPQPGDLRRPGGIAATGPLPGSTTVPGGNPNAGVILPGRLNYVPTGTGQRVPLPQAYIPLYQRAAAGLAAATGLSPKAALSLMLVQDARESGFNKNARSAAGALGIAQFMPATARAFGVNPLDPAQAIHGQEQYMVDLYRRFGNWPDALAAYNAGPGNYRAPAAQAYGQSVYGAAQQYQDTIDIKVTVSDQRTTARNVQVGHSRVVTGHKSYGPPHHPPPGPPHTH